MSPRAFVLFLLISAASLRVFGANEATFTEGSRAYQAGDYELLLHVDEYFTRKEAKLPTPPFLSKVPVRIRVVNVAERIHLPIQFGPWSYTYSRGS